MTRRPGLSLVEVLAALFIMGIGLISLFTLFPYGALQYASAFKDDRTAQCANAAESYMRVYWKERVIDLPAHANAPQESFVFAMDNPNQDTSSPTGMANPSKPPVGSPPNTPQPVPSVFGLSDPSYPVFVDPMGWVARSLGSQDKYWVASQPIARRNLFEVERVSPIPPPNPNPINVAAQRLLALRECSLLDGLSYSNDGRAADAGGAAAEGSGLTVQKELRYNWLWVLQRPNNTVRSLSKLTVVVFDKRAHLHAPTTAEQGPFTPTVAQVSQSRITFPAGSEPAGLKKGMWLLDGTTTSDFYLVPPPTPGPPIRVYFSKIRNAHFYRVVSVTQTGTDIDVELHQPLKPESKTRLFPSGHPSAGVQIPDATASERQFYLLAGVADVFEKTPLANSTNGP